MLSREEGAGVARSANASHSAIRRGCGRGRRGCAAPGRAADEHRQLQPEMVDLGQLLDVDVGDDGADAVPELDQPSASSRASTRRTGVRLIANSAASSSSDSRVPGG